MSTRIVSIISGTVLSLAALQVAYFVSGNRAYPADSGFALVDYENEGNLWQLPSLASTLKSYKRKVMMTCLNSLFL